MVIKVKDLIDQLNKLDPTLDIYGYTEDDCLGTDGRPYLVFSIESTEISIVERERDSKGRPLLKFSDSEQKGAGKVAFINLSTDF